MEPPHVKGPYEPLDHDREQIRVLRIIATQGGTDEEALHLETRTVSLLVRPSYECVSYCWGDPDKTEDVFLNGLVVPVTTNLASALRCFRTEAAQDLWLWADAICIDQENVDERNRQVQLMDRIYSDAFKVRAWVEWPAWAGLMQGRLTPHELRLQGAERCRAALDFLVLQESGDATAETTLDKSLVGAFAWLGILFASSFWHRIWITQELVLAQRIEVTFGQSRYELVGRDKFRRLSQSYVRHFAELMVALRLLQNVKDAQPDIYNLMAENGVEEVVPQKLKLLEPTFSPLLRFEKAETLAAADHLLDSYRSKAQGIARAGRKHDYVYGMLGLVPPEVRIAPDYSKSYQDVFTEYTYEAMRATRDHSALLIAMSAQPDMPSWVVDYSQIDVQFDYHTVHQLYSAEKFIETDLHQSGRGMITVNGIRLDIIKVLSPKFENTNRRKQLHRAMDFYRAHYRGRTSDDISTELIRILLHDTNVGLVTLAPGAWHGGRLTDAVLNI
ncbi:hypothetical protein B0A48_12318 [Cryoendolithus antarcticus]|uniref:Heterokaryon incompatibility domain-containing protein n=1 Tax=Cryoendolithus antarcticus TaxID=1507870 RepID=A0A1V8SRN5_9PEZI|nr:hypothetical protein B0A48_12318 [Cryoendolithus antarcticus]